MNHLVSVVIPTYNAIAYLPEAVNSVLSQTHQELEVLVVDDGSTDGTCELDVLGDRRVEYIRITHTGGPASPRNVGIKQSRGELVAFLDADDAWRPAKLERQIEHLHRTGAALVYCDGEVIDATGKRVRASYHENMQTPSGDVFIHLYSNNFIPASSVVVRREALAKVGPFSAEAKFKGVEDYELWLRISAGFRIGYLTEILFRYRERAGSLSDEDQLANYARLLAVWERHYARARSTGDHMATERLWRTCKLLAELTPKGDLPARMTWKLRALRYFPIWKRTPRDLAREVWWWLK
jgi:glycosyltransferase involved in cell wall biosynthesis